MMRSNSNLDKMIAENTIVRTLIDNNGFPAGTTGVAVSLYSSGPACEVELWDDSSYPVDVVTYLLSELESVH